MSATERKPELVRDGRRRELAYLIAEAWGFEPSTLLVWAKAPHGLGLARGRGWHGIATHRAVV